MDAFIDPACLSFQECFHPDPSSVHIQNTDPHATDLMQGWMLRLQNIGM